MYMNEVPGIINSKIISDEWDGLWEEPALPEIYKTTATVLVITKPYEPGSGEDVQLQKMLQACKLGDDDYNILQLDDTKPVAWYRIKEKWQPRYVLLLGVLPAQLGISAMFGLFHPNRFGGCTWIPGLSLQELEKQPEAKKQLWQNGLKPVFVDKN